MLIGCFLLVAGILLNSANGPFVVRDRIDDMLLLRRIYNLIRLCTGIATIHRQFVAAHIKESMAFPC